MRETSAIGNRIVHRGAPHLAGFNIFILCGPGRRLALGIREGCLFKLKIKAGSFDFSLAQSAFQMDGTLPRRYSLSELAKICGLRPVDSYQVIDEIFDLGRTGGEAHQFSSVGASTTILFSSTRGCR